MFDHGKDGLHGKGLELVIAGTCNGNVDGKREGREGQRSSVLRRDCFEPNFFMARSFSSGPREELQVWAVVAERWISVQVLGSPAVS